MMSMSVVLWVDEDQCELPVIASMVEGCGGTIMPAMTVEDARVLLGTSQPSVVILDSIVATGKMASEAARLEVFPGLSFVGELPSELVARTIVVSVVPREVLLARVPEARGIPADHFFWKGMLGRTELQRLRRLLEGLLKRGGDQ